MNQPNPVPPPLPLETPKPWTNIKLWAKDTAERMISTFVQVLVPFFFVGLEAGMGPWKPIVASVFPPVLTVLFNALPLLTPTFTVWWQDVTFRLLRTAAAASIGAAIADTFDLFQTSSWRGVLSVTGAAVLVFVKAEWARRKALKISGPNSLITPASLATVLPRAA